MCGQLWPPSSADALLVWGTAFSTQHLGGMMQLQHFINMDPMLLNWTSKHLDIFLTDLYIPKEISNHSQVVPNYDQLWSNK